MSTFKLPKRLDLAGANTVVKELREHRGSLEMDGSDVTHLGALGLQVLVAASRDAKARGDTFELKNSSEKMLADMEIMGVSHDQLEEGTV